MSIEAVGKFYEKVKNDEELQSRIMHLGAKTAEEALEAVTKIANAEGFIFEKEDLNAYAQLAIKQLTEERELNEAELDVVAGGGYNDWVIQSAVSLGLACLVSLAVGGKCKLNREPYTDDGE